MWRLNRAIVLLLLCWMSAVSAACRVSVVPVAFGNYDPSAASPTDATGTVDVTCDPNVSYLVRLDPGANSKGSFDQRAMLEPMSGALIHYNLYLDPALTQIWGDGTGNTGAAAGGGSRTKQLIHVYGRIPPGQKASPGRYNDAVTVTVEW